MKKLSKREKSIVECYVSKFASVNNWNYLKEHASDDADFQKKDTIFRKERATLWGMDEILDCLNVRFQCKRVDLEKIVLKALNAKDYEELYEVTLTYSSNIGWKIAN